MFVGTVSCELDAGVEQRSDPWSETENKNNTKITRPVRGVATFHFRICETVSVGAESEYVILDK